MIVGVMARGDRQREGVCQSLRSSPGPSILPFACKACRPSVLVGLLRCCGVVLKDHAGRGRAYGEGDDDRLCGEILGVPRLRGGERDLALGSCRRDRVFRSAWHAPNSGRARREAHSTRRSRARTGAFAWTRRPGARMRWTAARAEKCAMTDLLPLIRTEMDGVAAVASPVQPVNALPGPAAAEAVAREFGG